MRATSQHPVCLLLAVLGTGSVRAAHAQAGTCAAHGATHYICGVQGPEDLILIEGTSWVISSQAGQRQEPGGFYLIDARTHSFHPLGPDFSAAPDPIFSKCPGPPDANAFGAHGIAIRYRTGGRPQVYAVSHAGRESVEIFELDLKAKEPRLVWRGCVVAPERLSGNSVTPLPHDGFAVSSFGVKTDKESLAKITTGQVSGFVAEWSPKAGWSEVPGTEFSGDNGLVASKDGSTLYIAGWGDQKVHVVSRGKTPVTHQEVPLAGFHPDNIREGPGGSLIVAGQAADAKAILGCFTVPICPVGGKVVRLDPRTLALKTLVEEPGNPDYGGTSGAILVGNEVWLGTFKGNRIARVKLK